jgi:hypothetical protein
MMGKGQFTRAGNGSSPHQRGSRTAVVWSAEGPFVHQSVTWLEKTRHRLDLGDFQGLVAAQGWQQASKAPGQHRLATAWWTHQQHVVPAGSGDLKSSPSVHLSLDIDEINPMASGPGVVGAGAGPCLPSCFVPARAARPFLQTGYGITEAVHAPDIQSLNQSGFRPVEAGDQKGSCTCGFGQQGH